MPRTLEVRCGAWGFEVVERKEESSRGRCIFKRGHAGAISKGFSISSWHLFIPRYNTLCRWSIYYIAFTVGPSDFRPRMDSFRPTSPVSSKFQDFDFKLRWNKGCMRKRGDGANWERSKVGSTNNSTKFPQTCVSDWRYPVVRDVCI